MAKRIFVRDTSIISKMESSLSKWCQNNCYFIRKYCSKKQKEKKSKCHTTWCLLTFLLGSRAGDNSTKTGLENYTILFLRAPYFNPDTSIWCLPPPYPPKLPSGSTTEESRRNFGIIWAALKNLSTGVSKLNPALLVGSSKML